MRRTGFIAFILTICLLLSLSACFEDTTAVSTENSLDTSYESDASSSGDTVSQQTSNGLLAVHYLDVGQGDSIFIEFPDDRCMLIDASESQYKEEIELSIRNLGYERIDYIVATHPHADHIGGMTHILNSFEVGCIYLPDVSASTKTYITMAETILENDIQAIVAEAGVTVLSEGTLNAIFLAPYEIDESDQNKNSAVLYMTYGETSFLFMGDADTDIEQQIGKVDCDVLKVGHHGSRTASDATFLSHASPLYAIISCGEGNSYGHPHIEAVNRLEACGAEILRTDLLGKITVCSDGKTISVYYGQEENPDSSIPEDTVSEEGSEENETNGESQTWVLNTSSKKIHKPDCRHVEDIADKNRAETNKTIEDLTKEGYSACGTCKPHD